MNSHIILWDALNACDRLPSYRPPPPIIFGPEVIAELIGNLTIRIQNAAKRIAKISNGNVDMLKGSSRYFNLDVPEYRKAASVAELLRSSDLTHNAGHLDVKVLQQKIYDILARGHPFTLELGWGQAKRDAGLLKTAGFAADLPEMIAICRLAMLSRAVQLILDGPVRLRVITGGERFFEALFTNPAQDTAYNEQRATLVRVLGFGGVITFEGIDRYWSEAEIQHRLTQAMSADADPVSRGNESFQFALFNIDWGNLLCPMPGQPVLHPHGFRAPDGLIECFQKLQSSDRALLLRHILAGIANRKLCLQPISGLDISRQAFAEATAWAAEVAIVSARKYDLLGPLTPRVSGGTAEALEITVLEKPRKSAIPRLMLLGKRAAERLPQHVIAVLGSRHPLRYCSYITVVNSSAPIHLYDKDGYASCGLSWCEPSSQPLCLTTSRPEDARRALIQIDPFELH